MPFDESRREGETLEQWAARLVLSPPSAGSCHRPSTSPRSRGSRAGSASPAAHGVARKMGAASSPTTNGRRASLMAGHVRKHGGKYQAVVVDGYGRGAQRRFGQLHRRKGDAQDELVMMQSELLTGVFVDRQAGKVSLVERMRQRHRPAHATRALQHDGRRRTTPCCTSSGSSGPGASPPSSTPTCRRSCRSSTWRPRRWRRCSGTSRRRSGSAIADGVIGRDPTFKVQVAEGGRARRW